MNALYYVSNTVLAGVFASMTGYALTELAPEVWISLSEPIPALGASICLVASVVIGWTLLESRKYR